MTLPVAPSAISFNDINAEFGAPCAGYLCLNNFNARALAQVPTPSSTISMSNFYGKTAPPTDLGQCVFGGWYLGCTSVGPSNYYLIAAPQPAGYSKGLTWRIPAIPIICCTPQTNCQPDGYLVTKLYNNSNYPLMQWANGLSINGYSDWYVPAYTDASTVFTNNIYLEKFGSPSAANAGCQANNHGPYTLAQMQANFPYLGWPAAMPAQPTTCTGGPVSSTEYPSNPCGVNILAVQSTTPRWTPPFNQPAGCLFGKLNTGVFTRAIRRVPF